MPAGVLAKGKTLIKKYTIVIDSHEFLIELYFSPHKLPADVQDEIARRLGTRMIEEKPCLGINTETVKSQLESQDYSCVAFAKNKHHDDEASGTLQYYKWCEGKSKAYQLWIGDLCRIVRSSEKPKTSPLAALMQAFDNIARDKHLKQIWLMVENHEPEKTKLPKVYARYGFKITDECKVGDYIIMRKDITSSRRSTRKFRRQYPTD